MQPGTPEYGSRRHTMRTHAHAHACHAQPDTPEYAPSGAVFFASLQPYDRSTDMLSFAVFNTARLNTSFPSQVPTVSNFVSVPVKVCVCAVCRVCAVCVCVCECARANVHS